MDNSNLIKTREPYLDLVRILACVLVLYMHSTLPDVEDHTVSAIVTYCAGPCNALFFMVSGALLIQPSAANFNVFVAKRLRRILPPLLSWSIIYLIIKISLGRISLQEAITALCLFPLQATGCGYFWFMYVLLGCYLIVPMMSTWISYAPRRNLLIILGLWLVCSFIPLISTFTDITEEYNSWTYYFSGFFGFFILGFYLKKFPLPLCFSLLLGLGGIVLMIFTMYIHPNFYTSGKLYFYTQPYIILISVAIFSLIKHSAVNLHNYGTLKLIADSTFGIYLTHSLVLNYLFKDKLIITNAGSFIGMTIRVICTFIVCFLFIQFINRTPLRKILLA